MQNAASGSDRAAMRETQVGNEIDKLTAVVSDLCAVAEALEKRCSPVTVDTAQVSALSEARVGVSVPLVPRPVLCEVAHKIMAQAELLRAKVAQLHSLHDRIEV